MDLLPITHIPVSRWAPDISGGGNTVSISSICISRLGSFVSWGDGPGRPGQPLSFRIRQLHCQLTIVGQIVMYSAKLRRCCRCPDPGILDMGLNWRTKNLTKPIHCNVSWLRRSDRADKKRIINLSCFENNKTPQCPFRWNTEKCHDVRSLLQNPWCCLGVYTIEKGDNHTAGSVVTSV